MDINISPKNAIEGPKRLIQNLISRHKTRKNMKGIAKAEQLIMMQKLGRLNNKSLPEFDDISPLGVSESIEPSSYNEKMGKMKAKESMKDLKKQIPSKYR